MGAGGESSEISISRSRRSSARRGANLGSCNAASAAQCAMLSPSISFPSTTPMHPCRRCRRRSVTKTPERSAKTPSIGTFSGRCPSVTASTTTCRANRSNSCRSALERDGILGLLAAFEYSQLSALLDAIVKVPPEAQEILGRRNQGAHDHQPKQEQSERLERWMPGAGDQYRDGAYLQYHLSFADQGGRNRETFA